MNPHEQPTLDYAADAAAAELVRVLDEYLADLKAGKAPNREALIARHPALASQLEACLAGLEFIHGAEAGVPGKYQRLGDFRIIREVGRGGMGAVFEAEQVSLGRRVALKILRFGGISDPEAIERFKREAETVAKLHHTNIVPIFNVGSEQGVNYYAMQFIDGRSLAEVLAEKKGPLSASQVAEWGLQAAEALAHAHQRGVIHRDVKPSNLLLDRENRLWLTDFGLARRMDDVTLSITGTLLGTPRYMSPEQAAAAHKRVDHRSDLFSLGATLFELLTGTPAFPGETPHEVIQHILTVEPKPIRQLNSSVPRDLETIVMKCLAKEPRERYGAASELAADLRAFLDGRPICARRASFSEQAARWMKQQQRSVKLTATAVALTLLVTVSSILGWYGYDSWRQASLKLGAATPPLVVEIFDGNAKLVRTETAPMQNAARFPAGDYQVRVAAEGKLSETFDVSLTRGSDANFTIDLHDQLLWTPRDLDRSFDVVNFGAEQGLVLWNEKGIGLRRNDHPLGWTRELGARFLPKPDENRGFRWPWNQAFADHTGYGPFDTRPWVSPRAIDIDGHGMGDLIIAARHQGWLMAVSGEEGTILWFASRGHDLAQPAPQSGNYFGSGIKSAILGTPIQSPDCNGDGVPDVIATMADIGPQPTLVLNRYAAKCWVEAISGKTGENIWKYDILPEWFDLPAGQEVPYDLRWFAGTGGGLMNGGRGGMTAGRRRTRAGNQYERTGPHGYRPAAVSLITVAGESRLGIVAGTKFVALDPATGKPASKPIELSARPGKECQWGDVDGDDSSDLVLLEKIGGTTFPMAAKTRMVVWSPVKQMQLWEKKLDAIWPQQPTWTVEEPRWPLVVDLNGDKRCEIVVPDGRSKSGGGFGGPFGPSDIPWGIVAVLAGDTGKPQWTRRLVSMDQQVDHFVAGPDLDQDGYREVYVATLEGMDFRAHIDALSGQKGVTLWTNSVAPPPDTNSSVQFYLAPPHWWQAGAEGWPQLVIHVVEGDMGNRRSIAGTFSAGTGKMLHVAENVTAVSPADIDGDGTEDLLVYDSKTPRALDLGGKLHCVRGVAGEKWARLGDLGNPAVDFDFDGIRDLVSGWPNPVLTASSGATGSKLWQSQVSEVGREYHVRPAATHLGTHGDLDGDGTEDLLGWTYPSLYRQRGNPFFAVSGRTGRKLWISDISTQLLQGVIGANSHDLDGDGKAEVIWLAALDYGYPLRESVSSHESQLWVFVTSGQTGQLRWSQPLSVPYGQSAGNAMQINIPGVNVLPNVGDLNGDGISDVLVPALLPDGRSFETQTLSGKDGKVLWSRRCPADPNQQATLENWVPPTVCNLDGAGKVEVVLAELSNFDASGKPTRPLHRVVCLHGNDGSEVWSWTSEKLADTWYPHGGQSKPELRRPRLLRTGNKQERIAVLLPGNDGAIAVFGADGKPKVRNANYQTSMAGIWPCDANGDGVDELAFFDHANLCVASPDQLDQPLWTKSIGSPGEQRILGVFRQGEKKSPVIAVARDASDNSVLGFDGATGRMVWSCPGLITRDAADGTFIASQHVALLDEGRQAPPNVYFNYGAVSRSRQGAYTVPITESKPTDPSSPELIATKDRLNPRGVSTAAANLGGSRDDVRWQRDLPWVEWQTPTRESVLIIAWGLVFAAFLVVLPGAYLMRLIVLRRFSLRLLMALPLVAALFLSATMLKPPLMRDFSRFMPRMWLALAFAPVVVALGLLGWWVVKGKWGRVLFWVGATLAVSGICAAVLLSVAMRQSPLLSEESYRLSGWYLIGFNGAFLTAWMMIVVVPIEYLVVAGWTWLRSRRRTIQPPKEPSAPPPTMAAKAASSP